jgi:molecular chaperone DnaK
VDDLERRFREVEKRLEHLRGTAAAAGSGEAHRRLDAVEEGDDLESARDQVRAARVDDGAAAAADTRLREVQAGLDEVEDTIAIPTVLRGVEDTLADAAPLVESRGRVDDRREAADIRAALEALRARPDVEKARALHERAQRFLVRLLREGPEWEAVLFHALRERVGEMRDRDEAAGLVREGERAVGDGDRQALGAVNTRLQRLLPTGVSVLDGGVTTRPR